VTDGGNATPEVRLRPVEDQDVDVFFAHQADPVAAEVAAFPSRDKARFAAHWAKIRSDPGVTLRTIEADGEVAGNIGCWQQDGMSLLGYWIGREYWGRGIATQALVRFLGEEPKRPLYAHVAVHNAGSIRLLQNAHFQRAHELESVAPVPADGVEELIFVLEA
jgi:RimJ/RimL family protein N-acetyltransferase